MLRTWDDGVRVLYLSIIPVLLSVALFSACTPPHAEDVDKLNEISYSYHYRNLDSTTVYAKRALAAAEGYEAGQAEALNNLAFVSILKMDYQYANKLLDSISLVTDNQVELLVADVQRMRLCQRQSQNKDFYNYRESAVRRMHRIQEEPEPLNAHLQRRMVYATSEFQIVTSTYYYYVGLEQQSVDALMQINPDGEVRNDTAQLLAYHYNVGAGGIITHGTQEEINQLEFDHLMRCHLLARQFGYIFWEANSLQAMSEHLQVKSLRERLIQDNLPAMKFINVEHMPDSLLAGNLAQRSLDMFVKFGDVYQIAGSYRTLAQCYWQIEDYPAAISYLEEALTENSAINQAPDLVASIREQLSVAYSAVDDKPKSDANRNIYLDLQDETRQDRYLESRADQLEKSSVQLNWMIAAVVAAIIILIILLLLFDRLRRRSDNSIQPLLKPLQEWKHRNEAYTEEMKERFEEIQETLALNQLHVADNKKRHLEQRAKVSLVNSVMPFIDRMLHEIHHLQKGGESESVRAERYTYIAQLTDQISSYNDVLTEWIQMRHGELSLHIESFPLHELFDLMKRSRMSFQMKGINLQVEPTDDIVKADRILTLFMLNTLADNARKFTPEGGNVTIASHAGDDYVEISVSDTGKGMSEEEALHLFDYKPIRNVSETTSTHAQSHQLSHGFGLMNCKGIIEKYRKISKIFSVCQLTVQSEQGRGSRFAFRLPKGLLSKLRMVMMLVVTGTMWLLGNNTLYARSNNVSERWHSQAQAYTDSIYDCNIRGDYQQALVYADSCVRAFNAYYSTIHNHHHSSSKDKGSLFLLLEGNTSEVIPDVEWYHDSIHIDYKALLSMRNECAVAALAMHRWSLYKYNNKVYTQLFKEMSADATLGDYCMVMQKSESNKNVAIVLLVILFLSIFPAYYFIYYRHRVYERFCIEQVKNINALLLGNADAEEKLMKISKIDTSRFPDELQHIVMQIKDALVRFVEARKETQTNIELAEDECRRSQYENEKLHISNSVLDNCLSTLKHETMYYPSRIRQLVDGGEEQLTSIGELAAYYKELYTILSLQAMRQVDSVKPVCKSVAVGDLLPIQSEDYVLGDPDMLNYLFDILRKEIKATLTETTVSEKSSHYLCFSVPVHQTPSERLSDEDCQQLFTPSVGHLPYLFCRQIVRDTGESTNLRGCGIVAEPAQSGMTIVITLARSKTMNTDEVTS